MVKIALALEFKTGPLAITIGPLAGESARSAHSRVANVASPPTESLY